MPLICGNCALVYYVPIELGKQYVLENLKKIVFSRTRNVEFLEYGPFLTTSNYFAFNPKDFPSKAVLRIRIQRIRIILPDPDP